MIDSLRLGLQAPAGAQLHNFYVEKGAGTPSPQGTHLENVERWISLDGIFIDLCARQGRRAARDYSRGIRFY